MSGATFMKFGRAPTTCRTEIMLPKAGPAPPFADPGPGASPALGWPLGAVRGGGAPRRATRRAEKAFQVDPLQPAIDAPGARAYFRLPV